LGSHGGGGLDGYHLAAVWLVGAGACTDVQNYARVAEGSDDQGADPRIGLAPIGIDAADRAVVGVAGAAICLSVEHRNKPTY
jgi:hypothetical protein